MYRYFPQTVNVLSTVDLKWKGNLCAYCSMAGFLCHSLLDLLWTRIKINVP